MNGTKNFLPSKKFVTNVLIILVILVVFFAIKQTISYFRNRKTNSGNPIPVQMTVSNIVQKDDNNNGIPNWEEYLWGLDPSKNGPENKEFILAKKKSLTENGIIATEDDSAVLTQNEILSRQFFATLVSLQETGQLDETSMQSVAEAIGQNVETTPLDDIYTRNMLTIKSDSLLEKDDYQKNLSDLVSSYQDADIGSELTLISGGLASNDPQALYAAKTVADSYRSFGQELIVIPVPSSLVNTHLDLANNYEKVAQSIEGLTMILTDPIVGMRATINYKKYSDLLTSDLEKIYNALQ